MTFVAKLLAKADSIKDAEAIGKLEESAKVESPKFVEILGGPSDGKTVLEPNIEVAKFKSLASLENANIDAADIVETPPQRQEGLTDEEFAQLRKKEGYPVENNAIESPDATEIPPQPQEGLTDDEKAQIKEETGWSDEIINSIKSMEQYEIYKNADLREAEMNGRKCLIKNIDMDYVDEKTGLTNRELMERGRSPIDPKTGEKIELHHMGQDYDAPFAELNENSEHGNGNHSTLHPKTEGSWRNTPELTVQYQKEKQEYWKARAKGGE